MKIQELWTLLPDYVPNPPLQSFPRVDKKTRLSKHMGEIGDGSFRWCACRSFQLYLPKGKKFGQPILAGDTLERAPLRDCPAVTRGCFHVNHHKVILVRLAEAKAYGYKACFVHDPEPLDPFEAAIRFGMSVHPAFVQYYENTLRSVSRRKDFIENLRDRGHKSAVTQQADRIAQLL